MTFEQFQNSTTLQEISDDFIAKLEFALMYISDKSFKPKYSMKCFDGVILVDEIQSEKRGLDILNAFTDEQVDWTFFSDLFDLSLLFLGSKTQMISLKQLDPVKTIKFDKGFAEEEFFDFKASMYSKKGWLQVHRGLAMSRHKTDDERPFLFPRRFSLKKGKYLSGKIDLEVIKLIHDIFQLSLTYYYEWFAYIKDDTMPIGLKIPIDPSFSKKLFNKREKDGLTGRRKAICNFVREHYRILPSKTSEVERAILIKKHFRGETKIRWRGLNVDIIPSKYDLNRIATSKSFLSV